MITQRDCDRVIATTREDLADLAAQGWSITEDAGEFIARCPGYGREEQKLNPDIGYAWEHAGPGGF